MRVQAEQRVVGELNVTLPSTNLAPDGGSLQEEINLPGTLPQLLC